MTTALEHAGVMPPPRAAPRRPHPSLTGWLARAAFVAALVALACWYVLHFAPVHSDVLASGVILAISALSLNVLIGYAGQISLGQQAFVGIGAFTSAYVISQSDQTFYVGLAAAAAVGIAQALVLGLIALRVRGLYFALVTLVWGFVGENSIFRLEGFTGGGAGQDAPRPGGFTTDRAYLVLCVIVLALVLLLDWRLVSTKGGRAIQAGRESSQVAASFGVSVRGYTLLAFGLAGFYAGIAGALYASRRTNIVAEDFTFLSIALPALVVAVVGGLRHRGGIVLFAVLYVLSDDWLPEWARSLDVGFIETDSGLWVQAFAGLLAIVTLIAQPDGLGTLTAPIGRWLGGEPIRRATGTHGDDE
jgi:branched-chain amino acid transport system permease protein